jgi:hypothetical protein
MSDHGHGALPPKTPRQKRGFWQSVKALALHQFSGITLAGIAGTLIVAYFQNLSAYEDKVAALAKDDLANAVQTFTDTSTALSTAVSLQQRLIDYFYDAVCKDACKKPSQDDKSYAAKSARAMYGDYMSTYSNLHQSYNLLARRAEIFLDWPSDPAHDAAKFTLPTDDAINMSSLGNFGFDCEESMPPNGPVTNKQGKTLPIDWNETKYHVLTTQYCYDVTHRNMTAALQWASQTDIDQKEWDALTSGDRINLFKNQRATNQVLRLNAFIALAMSEIERMRVKYRPNGYWCSVPVAREMIGEKCMPIRIAAGEQRPGVSSVPNR